MTITSSNTGQGTSTGIMECATNVHLTFYELTILKSAQKLQ